MLTITIPTGDRYPVRGDLYLPKNSEPPGLVVLCHGFKGYRTWGFFPYIANSLRKQGLAALAIDFSHNGTLPPPEGAVSPSAGAETTGHGAAHAGESEGTLRSPRRTSPETRSGKRLKKKSSRLLPPFVNPGFFKKNTLKRERQDLLSVIKSISTNQLGGTVPREISIGLFGHSRGGISVILGALEFGEVKAISTWSTPAHPDVFSDEQKRKWREKGAYEFTDPESGVELDVGILYLNDIEEHYDFYRMDEKIKRLRIPYLIVHGINDMAVPVEAALRLYRAKNHSAKKRLVLVKTGHTFGAATQLSKASTALDQATEETVAWFKSHLIPGGLSQ